MALFNIKRDNKAFAKLLSKCDEYGPLDIKEPLLKSLSIADVASIEDSVNCDNAENVGKIIQASLDRKAIIKRNI